jgi:hypothetical protein
MRAIGVAAVMVLSLDPVVAAMRVGAARIDITPSGPIRLTGYAVRKSESEGVEQRLWAKALAIGSDREKPVVLVTVDNCGVGANVADEVAGRLRSKAGIEREQLAVCSSHTHAGPCIDGFAPNIFAQELDTAQAATITRYTAELTDWIESVALVALANRKRARVAWGQTTAGFAANRRTQGGPVDHSLPVLRVTDPRGNVVAVVANYACHCTTIGGEFNRVCGDWAGFAQEALERNHPGAIALITIGCGADANPSPRGGADNGLELAKAHGEVLAGQVSALLGRELVKLGRAPEPAMSRIELPFQPHFTRAEWEQRALQSGIVGYHARRHLARLNRGESLPGALPYSVQTWTFGRSLAMVFLPGEVVVDYALRLKAELDGTRLWLTSYANDVPCYIPSRRILQEGGYEAETSLWYYDRPQRLAPETEDLIVRTVAAQVPQSFHRGASASR